MVLQGVTRASFGQPNFQVPKFQVPNFQVKGESRCSRTRTNRRTSRTTQAARRRSNGGASTSKPMGMDAGTGPFAASSFVTGTASSCTVGGASMSPCSRTSPPSCWSFRKHCAPWSWEPFPSRPEPCCWTAAASPTPCRWRSRRPPIWNAAAGGGRHAKKRWKGMVRKRLARKRWVR